MPDFSANMQRWHLTLGGIMGNRYPTGGKINGSHTTMIEAAEVVVRAADKDPDVGKISLGIITNGRRSRKHRLKFKPINGGLQVVVYGIGQLQDIYTYTVDVIATSARLKASFLEKYPHAIFA